MSHLVSIITVTYNREKDIELCLDSLLASSITNREVIVVDNASTDKTVDLLEKKYSGIIKLVKSETNLMAGGGRNLGAKYATGEFLLFVDSDNVVDQKMVEELLYGFRNTKKAGLVGPLMYYCSDKSRIWWAGADINLLTSKTKYVGINEIDTGQYQEIAKVGHIPNCFMTTKEIWDQVGGIDSSFVMHYEESDLAEKIKKKGWGVYLIPRAKTWHNVPLSADRNIRNYGGESHERIYYTARNRVLFMRRNAMKWKFLIFLLIFNNIFLVAYSVNLLKNKKWGLAKTYFKGFFDGVINRKEQ